jgi:hypothetical protein
MNLVNIFKLTVFLVATNPITSDDNKQLSAKLDSLTLLKKLNGFIFNSSFYRVEIFLPTTNDYDKNFTTNAAFFKEKLKLFQLDLVKKRNSLCLFEIHKRVDSSVIKLDTDALKNFSKFSSNENDSFFRKFVNKMDDTVKEFFKCL